MAYNLLFICLNCINLFRICTLNTSLSSESYVTLKYFIVSASDIMFVIESSLDQCVKSHILVDIIVPPLVPSSDDYPDSLMFLT